MEKALTLPTTRPFRREGHINELDFEQQLKADGFTVIEHRKLDPRPGKERHRHLFEIRGLDLSGTFVVRQTGEPVAYRAGEIFPSPMASCTTSGSKRAARRFWSAEIFRGEELIAARGLEGDDV